MSRKWIPKTPQEIYKRAASRRRYHAQRRRVRDERQLAIMKSLVQRNWKHYGIGRILAKAFGVDPATISRDVSYILKLRARLVQKETITFIDQEKLTDQIILRLAAAGIHPRHGYTYVYHFNQRVSSLTVRRAYASSIRRPPRDEEFSLFRLELIGGRCGRATVSAASTHGEQSGPSFSYPAADFS